MVVCPVIHTGKLLTTFLFKQIFTTLRVSDMHPPIKTYPEPVLTNTTRHVYIV